MSVMILLVGEQPAPNLLPVRYYKPKHVGLVHTGFTKLRAERLAEVIGGQTQPHLCPTGAYRVDEIQHALQTFIQENKWTGHELIFNLTGGTKTMALAAYEVTRQISARAFYFQTEDNQSLIHPYRFENGLLIAEDPLTIQGSVTLDEYLRLYAGNYVPTGHFNDAFEESVYQALAVHQSADFEIMPAVRLTGLSSIAEVDTLVRCGNQVAVLEVKRSADKRGIDQLNGVTDQRTLGTYTRKILVSATPLGNNNADLAQAYRIRVVVLESGRDGQLSPADAEKLVAIVKAVLEPRP